jgi:hypothetical protein
VLTLLVKVSILFSALKCFSLFILNSW